MHGARGPINKINGLLSRAFCLEMMTFANQYILQTFACAMRETSQVAVVSLHVCCLCNWSGVCLMFQWQMMHDRSLLIWGTQDFFRSNQGLFPEGATKIYSIITQ